MAVRQEDDEELPLFQSGDLVLVQNERRKKRREYYVTTKICGT